MPKYYCSGDVVDVADYYRVRSAWVGLDGSLYYVEHCAHITVASKFWGFRSVRDCERRGYIHISECVFVYEDTPKPTDAQVNTVLLFCNANSITIPTWAMYPHEAKQKPTMSSKFMTAVHNRKNRDIFYPNSGD